MCPVCVSSHGSGMGALLPHTLWQNAGGASKPFRDNVGCEVLKWGEPEQRHKGAASSARDTEGKETSKEKNMLQKFEDCVFTINKFCSRLLDMINHRLDLRN